MINPTVPARERELALDFQQAQPFRHLVVDDFLEPGFCRALIGEFPAFDNRGALNERGQIGRKCVFPDLTKLAPAYQAFDRLMRDPAFLEFTSRIAGIPDLLYDPDYVGGGTHETLGGGDLDIHVDFNYHPRTRLHRRLNLIVFLNPEWEPSWGGALELHRDAWNPERDFVQSVVPLANRAVLFETTEQSWHGFPRITLPPERQSLGRKSLAVYFYTRQRPSEETASPHATVYVPAPLPAHLQAGHTLSEADVATLETLIGRRDTQLRFLYRREKDFARLIDGMTASPSFRLGRALTAPIRFFRRKPDAKVGS